MHISTKFKFFDAIKRTYAAQQGKKTQRIATFKRQTVVFIKVLRDYVFHEANFTGEYIYAHTHPIARMRAQEKEG